MLERSLVQSRGFRNSGPAGARTGCEFLLRLPNYRGMRASLADGVDVTIDSETFPYTANRLVIHGRELTLQDLRDAADLRWSIDEPIVVRETREATIVL